MCTIKVIEEGLIFDNPLPQLRSRHGYFPNLTMLDNGEIIAAFVMGEAFESVDLTTMLAKSVDGGRTWEISGPILDKSEYKVPVSDMLKITDTGNGRLIAAGYCFPRPDSDLPIGNPQTGGLLDNKVIFAESSDFGDTWSEAKIIKTSFNEPVEASAPITVLRNGWLATPITNFPKWNGTYEQAPCGKLLISTDHGKSWRDDSITMSFSEGAVTVYEQRMCQLEDGKIVVVAWNEDMISGKRLPNHFVISEDSGLTFSKPKSTGVMGQTSSVLSLGNNKILALHSIRRDTDRPGIYAYIVDLSKGEWDILYQERVWEPKQALNASGKMADIFSHLKFGQPSAIHIGENQYLMVNWVIEEGQGKIAWRKLQISMCDDIGQ